MSHQYQTRYKRVNRSFSSQSDDQGDARKVSKLSKSSTKSSSKSAVSQATSIKDMPLFNTMLSPPLHRRGHVVQSYSLRDIIVSLELDYEYLKEQLEADGKVQINDHLAKKCVQKIIEPLNGWIAEANVEVPGLNKLASLGLSTKQRPDVVVCNEERTKVSFIAEVQSSSLMLYTERIAAADLLRILKYSDEKIIDITTFAFPNAEEKHCLVEIKVTWDKLKFNIQMTRYIDLDEGVERLKNVIRFQCRSVPCLRIDEGLSKYIIKMSSKDCELLCGNMQFKQLEI